MIVRVSSEFVISGRIEDFLAKLQVEVIPTYTTADGMLSVLVLRRTLVGYCEIMIVSLWESNGAAIQFAGGGLPRAEFVQEFGVIQKETINFELVSIWPSTPPAQPPASNEA